MSRIIILDLRPAAGVKCAGCDQPIDNPPAVAVADNSAWQIWHDRCAARALLDAGQALATGKAVWQPEPPPLLPEELLPPRALAALLDQEARERHPERARPATMEVTEE